MKNEEIEDSEYTSKPFLTTLRDTVLFVKTAKENLQNIEENIIVKASILHCAFTIEALGNNLIQFIQLNRKLADSIDHLDVLSKFELFVLIVGGKDMNVNRGNKSMQIFSEFIKIRNEYVHPKIRKNALLCQDNNSYDSRKDNYNLLKISTNPSEWEYKDAEKCLVQLIKSIDSFLLKELKFGKNPLACMFFDTLKFKKTQGPIVPSESDNEWAFWLKNELKVAPKFYLEHVMKKYES